MIVDRDFRWTINSRGYRWLQNFEPDHKEGLGFAVTMTAAEADAETYAANTYLVSEEADELGKPIGGVSHDLRPLELSRLYYVLAETEPTEESVLDFASRFGPLTQNTIQWDGIDYRAEPFLLWKAEIGSLNLAYRCWRAFVDREQQPSKLREVAESLNPEAKDHPVQCVVGKLSQLVTEGLSTREHWDIWEIDRERRIRLAPQTSSDGRGIDLRLAPDNLIGAIWLQFAEALSSGRWRECKWCGAPFEYRNKSAQFCSDSHRQLDYQARKRAT